jgi:hypothetical protein
MVLILLIASLNQPKKIPDRPDMQTKELECKGLDKPTNQYFNKEWYSRAPWMCGYPREKALFCFPGILFEGGADIVMGWTAGVQFPVVSRLALGPTQAPIQWV